MADFEERSGIVTCETEWGRWYQTLEDVNLEINLTPGTKGREVKVDISCRRIECQIRGTIILKGRLFANVIEDESTWTIEDQNLCRILLVKSRKSDYWQSLLEGGQYQPNPVDLLGMRQKLDLERLQQENPGLDFSQATLDKQYPDMPSHLHSDLDHLGATALPVSIGENKTDDEKLLESRQGGYPPLPPDPGHLHQQGQASQPQQGLPEPPDARLQESFDRLSVETDDMKRRETSDVTSTTTASASMAVSASPPASASPMLDTRETDDMKTEPARVVEPVVTDDMKTEELR
jgi:hypothetical protein